MASRWHSRGDSITRNGDTIGVASSAEQAKQIMEAHNQTADLVDNVKWSSFHGCFTGDCPHDNANDCVAAIREFHEELGRSVLER